MKTFHLTHSRVEIHLNEVRIITIYFNQNSGKVYYRSKINTISEIKHTGIYLGVDIYGTPYFIHNHYQGGRPSIVTLEDFSKGQTIQEYAHSPKNGAIEIIRKALEEVVRGEQYHPVHYNCQTLVNIACNLKRQSEDVDKWMGRLFLGSMLLIGIGIFNRRA
ncbi:MAG TPA: hypothetical protein VK508_20995 [Cyclobacteriaceae bacterium]|nr:hypothetical protein [Cyclobacteriaceae bacterium]